MSTIVVPKTAYLGQFPCYQTEQDRYNDYMAKTTWEIPGELSGVIVSDVEPSVENRDKLWWKVDATNRPVIQVPFFYTTSYGGLWIAINPRESNPAAPTQQNEMILWPGTPAQLWSYDGGDGTDPAISTPTDVTGAMWRVVDLFEDRVAGGVGTNIAAVATDYDVLPAAASGGPTQIRGVYFAERTERIYYTP